MVLKKEDLKFSLKFQFLFVSQQLSSDIFYYTIPVIDLVILL